MTTNGVLLRGKRGSNGSSMTWTAFVVSGSHTAAASQRVQIDPTVGSGVVQVTAPASPSTGDVWGIKNVSSSSNIAIINGNGNNIEGPNDGYFVATEVSASGDGLAVTWEYNGTDWVVI